MVSSLLFRLERGPGIALQAMQEKKALKLLGQPAETKVPRAAAPPAAAAAVPPRDEA